jgi:hypothetical protein
MRRTLIGLLVVLPLWTPGGAWAVTEEDFKADTTRNLFNLCAVAASDKMSQQAVHFCQGYLVGAYDAHIAENAGPDGIRLVCLPDPPPSRNEAAAAFVAWARAHPQYMNEAPVETEFRFLVDTWPCRTAGAATEGAR